MLPQGTEAFVVDQACEIQPLPAQLFHTSSSPFPPKPLKQFWGVNQ